MSFNLQVLADHRPALLLAEVAAWLHMFGKFHEDFLGGHHGLDIEIPTDLVSTYPRLQMLLTDPWPSLIWSQLPIVELDVGSLSIYDLIKDHRNLRATSGLARLMWDAHGRGSGTEKGVLERFAPGQQATVFSATVAGHEQTPIDPSDLQRRRHRLYTDLERWLDGLATQASATDWRQFRSAFIQRFKKEFRTTVAESRRPINDVTLFDQTAASVALLKAALAEILLTGWKEPVQNAVADKYKWCFLRVGINGPTFWGEASRLSDVLARRGCLEKALDSIRFLLETEYPLGAEVYRDENGSIFVLPALDGLLQATINDSPLLGKIEKLAQQDFSAEACFKCEVSPATRNMLFLGRLATAQLSAASAKPAWIDGFWSPSALKDICPVCGVRPQGPSKKSVDRKICDVCEQRRIDRSRHWLSTQASTIWTDEIADETGHLALVTGAFHIESWLAGDAFNSVVMFDPQKRLLTDPRRNTTYQFDYQQLLSDIQDALRRNQFTGKTLLDSLVLNPQRGGSIQQFYEIQVKDSDLDALHRTGASSETLLALAMLRQNPSFARVRRTWETTRTFWLDVTEQLQQDESVIPVNGHRLGIQPIEMLDVGPFHAYELVVEGIRISVVWDPPNHQFITADNLDYLASAGQLGKSVEEAVQPGQRFRLEEPTGYGATNKRLGTITVDKVERIDQGYIPAIPILAEPRTFMALVPANRAMDVVEAIKAKYATEMGKVRNRLPLSLGVVYAGRRTPLASILDAGRRILRRSSQTVQAEVLEVSPVDPWPAAVEIRLRLDEREITVSVPTVMGDGATHDVWYPYWQVADKPDNRNRWFKGPDEEHWVHICDLRQGDKVAFAPSIFDFEYLDTSARRFEVAYNGDGQRMGKDKHQRPYLLEQFNDLEDTWTQLSHLSTSQIKGLEALIEAKRRDWDEPTGTPNVSDAFRQFVGDALREVKVHSARLESAAVTGMLADALEIHMTIHKGKSQQENA